MTPQEHRDCFAKMLPDAPGNEMLESSAGKAFAWTSKPSGGLAAPDRMIELDIGAWDECRNCQEFDSCYHLSMARLSLATAVQLRQTNPIN